MRNKVYFPNSMANLLLGGLNQWETVKGDNRVRGREKPEYFLLSHPAWWGILAMWPFVVSAAPGQLPWIDTLGSLIVYDLDPTRFLFLPGFPILHFIIVTSSLGSSSLGGDR